MSLAGGGGQGTRRHRRPRGRTAVESGGANAPTRTGLPLRHPRGRTRVCRWHGAPLVDCSDGARTLHGVWTKPEAQRAADIKVPILMHHQFTADPDGVPTWLRDNYLYIGDFEQQIAYIADDHHHLLTGGTSSRRSSPGAWRCRLEPLRMRVDHGESSSRLTVLPR
jgi:hypothetical protein